MDIEEENSNIDTFDGWDSAEEIDFFGEGISEVTEETVPKASKETPEEGKKTEVEVVEAKEEEEPQDLFDFSGDEETEEIEEVEKEDTKKEKKEKPTSTSTKDTLSFLKDKGLVEFELEEGEELTDELAEELLEDSFEESVDSKVSEVLSELPPIVKNMVKYAKDGGDVQNLLNELAAQSATGITKDLDMSEEKNQLSVLKQALKEDGQDSEYIETYSEFLKESGKLEGVSKKFFDKFVDRQDKLSQKEAEDQEQQRKVIKQRQKEYKKDLSEKLSENKELKSMKFTPKEKRELPNYISEPTVRLENGSTVTELQKDMYSALQDPEKTLILAKLLKSDFDFSSIKKEATTKVTEKVKNDLQHSNNLTSKSSRRSSRKKKNLEDYLFPED